MRIHSWVFWQAEQRGKQKFHIIVIRKVKMSEIPHMTSKIPSFFWDFIKRGVITPKIQNLNRIKYNHICEWMLTYCFSYITLIKAHGRNLRTVSFVKTPYSEFLRINWSVVKYPCVVSNCAKDFYDLLHTKPMLLSMFHKLGNWAPEKWCNLTKVTEKYFSQNLNPISLSPRPVFLPVHWIISKLLNNLKVVCMKNQHILG